MFFYIIHVLFCFLVSSKEIDYYCFIHVSGQGLFSEAKGRPKGGAGLNFHVLLWCRTRCLN